MGNQDIVQKLWNLCNVLRDDGITYHQYVTELTYILFLKMMKEKDNEKHIPEEYRWDSLVEKHGIELHDHYRQLLLDLGKVDSEIIQQIYNNATTNIEEPKNLEKIIRSIDGLDWYSAKEEGLGDLYEGLLEKNASETKSGAGQYFTPRPLIDVITRLVDPKPGERCNDPAAGTFGFMIAADTHVRSKTDDYFDLGEQEAEFQRNKAFTGAELVKDTHRLALMNALLHDIHGEIMLGDTLSDMGKDMKNYDVVLTNPPFGTKKGGERPTRDDLTFTTTNKQLNFLQHIYRSLKPNGKTRAAVIVPDDVLFKNESKGKEIRNDLMNKCDLHTILRLPTGIFYAPGVKTNVLFYTRGVNDNGNTSKVWVYDMRTNMPSFGKRTPLTSKHFNGFLEAYQADDRANIKDERWNSFTRKEIKKNDDSLDIGLIADDSFSIYENLPNPIESTEEAVGNLEKAVSILNEVIEELQSAEDDKNE
ncbi:class I SAM-dependent DNA methyltransferase [Virgibacillus halodenitrificans]|uniref:class I SAM-dependent DNA methyltransferase n=1 Tax=Virgibacillus halodenitrificans TaxID=1482 RepID=UPI002DBC0AFA|nr:N-6 DNA methylase [Virgibacillus halodenitrificans]MEC2158015.1 N-6 DNA methylase [Virgibacillus halodenitrificans]